MNAEERAKRALDTKRPHPTDKHSIMAVPIDLEGMVDPAGMSRRIKHDMVARVAEEIQAAECEAIEKCLAYIKIEWINEEGMLIAAYGQNFLDDVRNALNEVGEEEKDARSEH